MAERITRWASPGWQPEEEAALVAEAKRDPAAFGRLYDRYVQPVFRYLYSRMGSVPEAEDVTAQTFLAALESFERYRHQGHFAAWIFAIARSKTMDHYRRTRRQTSLEDAEDIPVETDLLQGVIQAERSTALARLIRRLPEDERELLRLRYAAELSFGEMAALLGRNEDAVKKSTYRLLARLQSQLDEAHD